MTPFVEVDGLVKSYVAARGRLEVLHGLARPLGQNSDGLGGFALEVAELALQHNAGQVVLLGAVKARQVAFEEQIQAQAAAAQVRGGDLGVGQKTLSRGVIQ